MKKLVRPMLATLVSKPLHRPGRINEEKYDAAGINVTPIKNKFVHRRTCLSILHTLFRVVFELPLKHASKTSTIHAAFLAIAVTAIGHWAFAQESSISDRLKDLSDNPGIFTPTLAIKDGGILTWIGRSTTGEPGKYLLRIPSVENHTVLASKTEYKRMNQETGFRGSLDIPKPVLSWETGANKSYLVPALEIPVFILTLNGFDRLAYGDQMEDGKRVYSTNFSTFWDHLIHGPWRYDKDAFHVNQFLHPYQGSIYHGFARSAGLNFWESLGYTFAGSFLWETAGETTHPSVNDQVASGIAGSFFGEVLFRTASLLLESGGGEPGFWRELGAAALSPPTGFNRLVFGTKDIGLFTRFERIVILLFGLFADRVTAALWVLAVFNNFSASQRIIYALRATFSFYKSQDERIVF